MSRVCVRVRPAELADVPGIVGLVQSIELGAGAFTGSPSTGPTADELAAQFEEVIRDGSRTVLAGVDEPTGEVVGLLLARCEERDAIDPTPLLHITHLMVNSRHRRRGVGRALLASAVHVAEDLGVDQVMVTAGAGSREANRYLSRIGFAPMYVLRVAQISVLRRSLGLADAPERMAVLRRARLVRAQRGRASARTARRGA